MYLSSVNKIMLPKISDFKELSTYCRNV